ncbi:MAG: PDZ domain-containing protein [Candidatus Zixiibacteriota bacterium]|nr:MAG: PDZ domain-containing protein [candidate division Zixibacteria bacterium]
MNRSPMLDKRSLFLSALFMVMIVIIAGGMAIYVLSDPAISDALSLTAAAFRIDQVYHDEVQWQTAIKGARGAIFEKLDRYSAYLEREDLKNLDDELEGSYSGIGVSIVFHEQGLLIMSVRESGPAAEVGLLSGDIIVAVDSVSLRNLEGEEAIWLLRGEEGTEARLKIDRPATDESFEVVVTRRRLTLMHIPFAGYTPDSMIYIRLLDFDAGATDDVRVAVDSLLAARETTPKGIILDLRGNPGGFLAEGYRTADLFLNEGIFMVGTDGRSRWNNQKHYSTGQDVSDGLPMAIIVDGGTASAGEIAAGALQAADRAVLIGDTTFGKGLVQGYVRFPDGDGLRLTVSRYYFEGPVYLNEFDSTLHEIGHGLTPDFYFDASRSNPFRRELENSLLLGQFAARNEDEIVYSMLVGAVGDSLVDRFIAYARENGFSYTSPRTLLAEQLKEVAEVEAGFAATFDRIDAIIRSSKKEDDATPGKERDYIRQRLLQIAYERKYGLYHTYKDILIQSRPEIAYASRILLEGH